MSVVEGESEMTRGTPISAAGSLALHAQETAMANAIQRALRGMRTTLF